MTNKVNNALGNFIVKTHSIFYKMRIQERHYYLFEN